MARNKKPIFVFLAAVLLAFYSQLAFAQTLEVDYPRLPGLPSLNTLGFIDITLYIQYVFGEAFALS